MLAQEYPFVLRQRLSEPGVAALADVLSAEKTDVIAEIANRFDARLTSECAGLRAEMAEFRTAMRSEMNALRLELRTDFHVAVANTRADLMKWSFLFWIGQVAAVIGLASVWR